MLYALQRLLRQSIGNPGPTYDKEEETITEFLTRFSLQNSAELHRSRNDDSKQVIILMKALPVSVFTDVQRSLSPKSIADASFEEVKETLISLYYTQKSVLGSTIHFLIAGNNQVNRLKNIRVK